MADRHARLSRIYEVTDLIWRRHMRQLANYEADLQANIKDEANVLACLGGGLPVSLLMSRLHFLRARRGIICEQLRLETEKAQQAGLRLKRIDRQMRKAN
jgi:hypothetical protein